MTRFIRHVCIAAAIATQSAAALAANTQSEVTSRASGFCFNGWSDAVPVVEREALTPVRELHTQARQRNIGEIVRITLCSDNGRFVYHLLVRQPPGRVVQMIVDARHPFSP